MRKYYAKKYNQLLLSDIYDNCKDLFNNGKSKFITLLENSIAFADFIPLSFYNAFNQRFGRKREYSLSAFVSALILQKVYSIPADAILINYLKTNEELREFCGFAKVLDSSKLTRFKQNLVDHLILLFNTLVEY